MWRAVLMLAVLAALMGAPSPLLAAPPNRLTEPSVTPATGTTLTSFVLSVRYTSDRGTPAQSVLAEVGLVSVTLGLVSGTAVDGVWSGSSLLPPGTWPVTFRAAADQGPQPSVAGPVLRVTSVLLPSPSDAIVDPLPSAPVASSTPNAAPGTSEASPPETAEPRPVRSDTPSPVASGEAAPAGDPHAAGASGGAGGGTSKPGAGGGESSAAPEPAPNGSAGAAAGGGEPSGDPASRGSQAPPGDDPGLLEGHPDEPATASLLLLLGVVVSVAAVTLLGTGWMLASRARDDEPEPSPRAAARRLGGRSSAAADAIEERRARRRARQLPGHDPVLAAMGLDAEEPKDPTRGVARGATPRSRPGGRR
jgi:hypothetical protein